jgi:hypothetical protein
MVYEAICKSKGSCRVAVKTVSSEDVDPTKIQVCAVYPSS